MLDTCCISVPPWCLFVCLFVFSSADGQVGEVRAKWISVLEGDGLLSGIFYLLGSCQYAKLSKAPFDLLLYFIQPVRKQKVMFVCLSLEMCGGGWVTTTIKTRFNISGNYFKIFHLQRVKLDMKRKSKWAE